MTVEIAEFGTTAQGRQVQAVTLRRGDFSATILTWGAVLQDLRFGGLAHSLTLGSDHLPDYEGAMRYHGSLIGPVVNRLSGASAPIGGKLHRFEATEGGYSLHCGSSGTHLKLWDVLETGADSVTLGLHLTDGDGGFPGDRQVRARFDLDAPATLRLTVTATTTAPTLINFANHSYWNLDGTPSWSGHSLRIAADRYLPTTPDFTPTGAVLPCAGSPLDFHATRQISVGAPPLDNCFCLSDAPEPLREVLWLTGQNGVTMTVATTDPAVQVYDGRAAIRPGHAAHEGLAVETQNWPDAPNHAGFPSIEIAPGQTYAQTTEWRFSRA